VLESLGYRDASPGDPGAHASQWRRAGPVPAEIDLHWQLPWTRADLESWTTLSANVEMLAIGDVSVEILAEEARTMLMALHAVQHGIGAAKPLTDLGLALQRVDQDTWSRAAALSRRLGAEEAFTVGLEMLPEGAALARRLDLKPSTSVEAHLRARTAAPTSVGWIHLVQQDSLRSALKLLKVELFPAPSFMRVWSPIARRGRVGLACAYVIRPLLLLLQVPAAARGLVTARRAAHGRQPQR
jgi:hypothetical protein